MSSIHQRLHLKVSQKQILTPSLVQMVTVLALNKLELKEMIAQEIMENPVLDDALDDGAASIEEMKEILERETPPADSQVLEASGEADPFEEIDFGTFFEEYLDPGYRPPPSEVVELPSFENFLSNPVNLVDHLSWQLTMTQLPVKQQEAVEMILGNLDENGYLSDSLEELAASSDLGLENLQEALALVHNCDPPGVGARDLRECMLIQLRLLGLEGKTVWKIASDYLHQLERKQFKEIAKGLGITVEEVEKSMRILKALDPFPGRRYNKTEPQVIEPDVYIVKAGENYTVVVSEDDLPQLRLNPAYSRMLEHGNSTKEVRNYVKERYTSALHLIKNIEQRKQTIIRVCESIIRRQHDFLDFGMDYLKPMMIKEVAEEIGVHPSTVSRAVASKYAHTPQGVYELRYFFSEAVDGPEGGSMPLLILKRKVKKMIEMENKEDPMTDDEIALKLNDEGISVNRRTVAKYRADMKIPSTHQRRERK